MKKQLLYLFIFSSMLSLKAQPQIVLQVTAGSRAPWGFYQNLVMDSKGKCTYTRSEVNGSVKESSSFNITMTQLNSFFAEVERLKFFNLKEKYDGGFSALGVFRLQQKKTLRDARACG